MNDHLPTRELQTDARPALTTRRGFVAGLSLAGVSLYGLWAAYGAAPLTFWGAGHDAAPHADGHGGHGAAAGGPTPDEFRRLVDEFIARHQLPDGSIAPDVATDHASTTAPEDHSGDGHDAHGAAPRAGEAHGVEHETAGAPLLLVAAPVDVYLAVQQWLFEPTVLRLRAGVPYHFRMMALDVSHGASLQLGRGSHVIRLRPGVLAERELTFKRPGEYLVYCTIYCGLGHDQMSATIIVG
jgi:cytochrome c oxidase subunit II